MYKATRCLSLLITMVAIAHQAAFAQITDLDTTWFYHTDMKLFGKTQEGSHTERLDRIEQKLYGHTTDGTKTDRMKKAHEYISAHPEVQVIIPPQNGAASANTKLTGIWQLKLNPPYLVNFRTGPKEDYPDIHILRISDNKLFGKAYWSIGAGPRDSAINQSMDLEGEITGSEITMNFINPNDRKQGRTGIYRCLKGAIQSAGKIVGKMDEVPQGGVDPSNVRQKELIKSATFTMERTD